MSAFEGKTVLVTGASAGIGEAAAHGFAKQGARVIAVARRAEKLRRLADSIEGECHPVELDVRDKLAVQAAVAALPPEWLNIDILVNNAGLARGLDRVYEGSIDDWEEMIDTNIKGLLYMTRAVLPGMVERGQGHVINIGSIAGRMVYPNGNVYCATKHAVHGLTKSFLVDLADTPVKVSTVDPGAVETEFSIVRFHGDKERADGVYKGWRPLDAVDVAEAIVWLASQPAHVQIAELVIVPTNQANPMVTYKGDN
jgi:NADP-dependent 3-hydroxy acid dehydrogenase YdfG